MDEIIAGGIWMTMYLEKKEEVLVLATGEKIVNNEDAILERKEKELEE